MRFISKLGASNSSVVGYHCEWERCGERSDGGASATSIVLQPYFEVSLQLCAGGKEGVGESPTSGATERPTLGWIVLVEFTLSILLPISFSLSSYFVLSSEIPEFRPMELASSISSLSLQFTIADRSWSNFLRNSRIALYRILNLIKRWLLLYHVGLK